MTTVANPPAPASGRAVTALVLGILGLVSWGLFAPVAWYLGAQELSQIRGYRAPQSGSGIARAGMIMGIIGSIPFLVGLAVFALAMIVVPFVLVLA